MDQVCENARICPGKALPASAMIALNAIRETAPEYYEPFCRFLVESVGATWIPEEDCERF